MRIKPERILYYLENICLMVDEQILAPEGEIKRFLGDLYMWCHIGTAGMHNCKHSDWEESFLEAEQKLVDSKFMKSYDERKKKGRVKLPDPMEFLAKKKQKKK